MTLLYMPWSFGVKGKYELYPAEDRECQSWGGGPSEDPWNEACELDAERGVKISLSVGVESSSYDCPPASLTMVPLNHMNEGSVIMNYEAKPFGLGTYFIRLFSSAIRLYIIHCEFDG